MIRLAVRYPGIQNVSILIPQFEGAASHFLVAMIRINLHKLIVEAIRVLEGISVTLSILRQNKIPGIGYCHPHCEAE